MKNTEIPKFVPLPEVPHYSEEVTFGNLGLPVGFDDERLLVNLNAINRVRKIAGLGQVSIIGSNGELDKPDIAVTSLSPSGEATAGAVGKRQKKPLTVGKVTFPGPLSNYYLADAVININSTEIESRIHESSDKGDRLFNPGVRASYLNTALKRGLINVSKDANFDTPKCALSVMV